MREREAVTERAAVRGRHSSGSEWDNGLSVGRKEEQRLKGVSLNRPPVSTSQVAKLAAWSEPEFLVPDVAEVPRRFFNNITGAGSQPPVSPRVSLS